MPEPCRSGKVTQLLPFEPRPLVLTLSLDESRNPRATPGGPGFDQLGIQTQCPGPDAHQILGNMLERQDM